MSLAGGVPAFDGKQQWRLASGLVPGCPIGTVVTLSHRGELLDVSRPWAGLVASIDVRTAILTLSPDGGQCLVQADTGEALFARVADASSPGLARQSPPATQWVLPSVVPALAPEALPLELARVQPLRYLEGTWTSAGYRSGRTRARWTQALFVLTGVACFWYLLLTVQKAGLAVRAAAGTMPALVALDDLNASLHSALDLVVLCGFMLAIAFFAWLSRTTDVVPALGGGTPKDSPRASVGWWFVPIVDFWKPYSILRELWDRLSVPSRPAGGLVVPAWWLPLIGGFLLDKFAAVFVAEGPIPAPWSELQLVDLAEVAVVTGYFIAAVFGLLMVHEIQARADFRAHALGFDTRPATLPFAPGPTWTPAPAAAVVPDAAPGPAPAAEALRGLNELHEQGLVTDAEYAAKRTEIIGRL